MLDGPVIASTLDRLWRRLECRILLPEPVEQFLAPKGPLPILYSDQRKHRRFHYRQRAILTRRGQHAAVYTKDISRGGLCFLHFEQVLPLEEVSLALPFGTRVNLIVRRCRRLRERCFECGAEIHDVTQELERELLELVVVLANQRAESADAALSDR